MQRASALTATILSAAILLWAMGSGMAMRAAATGLVREVAGHALVIEGLRHSVLAAGAQLHVGDTLQAGHDGPFQIIFAGDVILTVAAGARLTLTASALDVDGDAGAAAVLLCDLARGVTGAALEAVGAQNRIVSPPPSIGVRG